MIEVRRLLPGDEDAALLVLDRLGDTPPLLASVHTFLASGHNYLVVGYLDGAPEGFAIAYLLPYIDGRGPMLFLWEIGVHEAAWRKGVGSAIVRWLLDAARPAGCSELFVITNAENEAAMRLYASTGGVREALDDVVFVYDFKRGLSPP